MSDVPDSHPRAHSLRLRDRLKAGVEQGIADLTGLVAHGRGEAFYYLLGEQTHPFAERAIGAASALLLTARHPAFSVNGNVAALAAGEIVELTRRLPKLVVEANVFHFSEQRLGRIVDLLHQQGLERVLGLGPWTPLPGLDSARRRMANEGIAQADVVMVPLEDGDRCEALIQSGRQVITVDLNPLSRTARTATVTIVDELTRVLPRLAEQLTADQVVPFDELRRRIAEFDNGAELARALDTIRSGANVSGSK